MKLRGFTLIAVLIVIVIIFIILVIGVVVFNNTKNSAPNTQTKNDATSSGSSTSSSTLTPISTPIPTPTPLLNPEPSLSTPSPSPVPTVSKTSVTVTDNFKGDSAVGSQWEQNQGTWGIEAGHGLKLTVGGPYGVLGTILTTAGNTADQFSEYTLADDWSWGGTSMSYQNFFGPCIRFNGTALYDLLWAPGYQGSNGVPSAPATGGWIIKYDYGKTSYLLASVGGTPPGPGDTLRLEAQGSTIRGYKNGVLLLQAVDTRLTTQGKVGLHGKAGIVPMTAASSWRGGDL